MLVLAASTEIGTEDSAHGTYIQHAERSGYRILVAEDNPVNSKSGRAVTRALGLSAPISCPMEGRGGSVGTGRYHMI